MKRMLMSTHQPPSGPGRGLLGGGLALALIFVVVLADLLLQPLLLRRLLPFRAEASPP